MYEAERGVSALGALVGRAHCAGLEHRHLELLAGVLRQPRLVETLDEEIRQRLAVYVLEWRVALGGLVSQRAAHNSPRTGFPGQNAFRQLGPPNPPAQEHFPFTQPQS